MVKEIDKVPKEFSGYTQMFLHVDHLSGQRGSRVQVCQFHFIVTAEVRGQCDSFTICLQML